MVFFHSTCPFCEQLASKWSNASSVATNVGHLPVVWTTVSLADTGAAEFVQRHNLPQPWYAIRTVKDHRNLGTTGWPTLYVLSRGGRFEGEIAMRGLDDIDIGERCVPEPRPETDSSLPTH